MICLSILKTKMSTCTVYGSEICSSVITKCPYCNFEVCITCNKQYIVNTLKTDKECMNCHKKLSRKVLVNMFGNNYVNNLLKDHIKELLFKEEMILIPKSLPVLENNKKIKKYQDLLIKLREEYNEKFGKEFYSDTIESEIALYNIYAHQSYIYKLGNKKNKVETKKYKYPCSNNDCNGFVNESWVCDLCDKKTCKTCLVIMEDDHECLEENIETANIIRKSTKPCPKCNISIAKVDGCDQMWCVSCHTTFDWKTLTIKKSGVIHNPEYFRYLRENGIVIQRNPDECINEYENAFNILSNFNWKYKKEINEKNKLFKNYTEEKLIKYYTDYQIRKNTDIEKDKLYHFAKDYADRKMKEYSEYYSIINIISEEVITDLFKFYRSINHIEDVVINTMTRKIENYENWKDLERIKYLEKTITEKQYKTNLARKYKEKEFLEEKLGIQNTIIELSKDCFISLTNQINNECETKIKENGVIDINSKLSVLKNLITDIKKDVKVLEDIYKLKSTIRIPDILITS